MTDLSQEIAAAQEPSKRTAFDLVQSMRAEIAKALPSTMDPERFMRLTLTELRTNPQLAQCTASSLLGALMVAARCGLEVGGPLGEFYLTPRRLRDEGWAVVPVLGFKGLLKLCWRSGQLADIKTLLIREGDSFTEGADSERGPWYRLDLWPDEDGNERTSRSVVGVLAHARLTTGGNQWEYLSTSQVLARRDRGSAKSSGPWATDTDEMFKKTALRALAKQLPQSTDELMAATTVDEQVQHEEEQA